MPHYDKHSGTTSDICLAAYLYLLNGAKYVGVKKALLNNNKAEFIFENVNREDIVRFYNLEAMVEPQAFLDAIRQLKHSISMMIMESSDTYKKFKY